MLQKYQRSWSGTFTMHIKPTHKSQPCNVPGHLQHSKELHRVQIIDEHGKWKTYNTTAL